MSQLFKFFTPIKVRFNEADLQGHVNFANYLFYFDVGLMEYMTVIGYDYRTMLAGGVDFLFAEAHSNYKSSAKWPEVLNIYTRISHLGQRSVRFDFEVHAAKDARLVATGHIVAVTAARNSFEPRQIPEGLRRAVAAYENGGSE